ncbi:MAG: hypothetical protein EOP78_09430 [Variovorax sp.]|nr:MAG: hypothetical protein EOP78_09430 [Variovorax sp.]
MSIMSGARDTLATLVFEQALRQVRDRQLERVRERRPMTEAELHAAERDAALSAARHVYRDETAMAMGIASLPGERDHRKDYASRTTAAADMALLATHRLICAVPIVGDPEHAVR